MARVALRHLVEEADFLQLAGECEDGTDAVSFLMQQPVDLLFLDVEMPRMSGLELLESLRQRPLVILITSKRDYAVEAFDFQVVDYLVKPVTYPRFVLAVQRARELFQQSARPFNPVAAEPLFVRSGGNLVRIRLEDILFLQALGDYVTVVTADKRLPVHATMKEMEQKLPPDQFVRTHRSYIVALPRIDHIEENTIRIDKHLIPVSEGYRPKLMERLRMW